jgi:hypothetical protein
MTADGGEMGHAHAFVPLLADQRQPRHTGLVVGEARPDLVQETAVDLIDDLQVPRQQLAEHGQRPGFQGLRQQGVIGVADGLHRDGPGRIPVEQPLVGQQTHQLGHPDGGMGVVELHREALRQRFDRLAGEVERMRSMSCREQERNKYCCPIPFGTQIAYEVSIVLVSRSKGAKSKFLTRVNQ